jgi:hypothetical protein
VRKFLDLGFGVHGLELKGLAGSIASKYSMFGLLRDCEIGRRASCRGSVGREEVGFL